MGHGHWKGLLAFLPDLGKKKVRFPSYLRGKMERRGSVDGMREERPGGGNTKMEVASGTWPGWKGQGGAYYTSHM